MKTFIELCKRADATRVTVKRNKRNTKFKVRCRRYLYTLVMSDAERAKKLKKSLPPKLEVLVIDEKSKAKARK